MYRGYRSRLRVSISARHFWPSMRSCPIAHRAPTTAMPAFRRSPMNVAVEVLTEPAVVFGLLRSHGDMLRAFNAAEAGATRSLEEDFDTEASREAASIVLAPASAASSPPEQSLVPVDATAYSVKKGLGVNLLENKSCSVEARSPH